MNSIDISANADLIDTSANADLIAGLIFVAGRLAPIKEGTAEGVAPVFSININFIKGKAGVESIGRANDLVVATFEASEPVKKMGGDRQTKDIIRLMVSGDEIRDVTNTNNPASVISTTQLTQDDLLHLEGAIRKRFKEVGLSEVLPPPKPYDNVKRGFSEIAAKFADSVTAAHLAALRKRLYMEYALLAVARALFMPPAHYKGYDPLSLKNRHVVYDDYSALLCRANDEDPVGVFNMLHIRAQLPINPKRGIMPDDIGCFITHDDEIIDVTERKRPSVVVKLSGRKALTLEEFKRLEDTIRTRFDEASLSNVLPPRNTFVAVP